MEIPSKVQFCNDKTRKSFESLKEEDSELYNHLLNAMFEIERNAFSGISIPKRLMPREYVVKYKIHNLWKYNLPGAWRLLYSIESDGVLVVAIILEWLNHKSYERRFGY